MIARSLSSHGPRSSSVSGSPRAIFATLSGVWWSSPSTKRHPSAPASAAPTVVLPLPATPMITTTSAGTPLLCHRVSRPEVFRRGPLPDYDRRPTKPGLRRARPRGTHLESNLREVWDVRGWGVLRLFLLRHGETEF